MTPLTIHARPTRLEIAAARLLLCVRTPVLLASLLAGALVPLLFWAVGVGARGSALLFAVPPLLALVLPVAFVASGLAGRAARDLAAAGQKVTLSAAGIGVESAHAAGTMKWSAARAAWETGRLFVLWAGDLRVIPKRCLASPDDAGRIRALLREHLGARARLR